MRRLSEGYNNTSRFHCSSRPDVSTSLALFFLPHTAAVLFCWQDDGIHRKAGSMCRQARLVWYALFQLCAFTWQPWQMPLYVTNSLYWPKADHAWISCKRTIDLPSTALTQSTKQRQATKKWQRLSRSRQPQAIPSLLQINLCGISIPEVIYRSKMTRSSDTTTSACTTCRNWETQSTHTSLQTTTRKFIEDSRTKSHCRMHSASHSTSSLNCKHSRHLHQSAIWA